MAKRKTSKASAGTLGDPLVLDASAEEVTEGNLDALLNDEETTPEPEQASSPEVIPEPAPEPPLAPAPEPAPTPRPARPEPPAAVQKPAVVIPSGIALDAFVSVSGVPWTQMAGFSRWAQMENLGPMGIREWRDKYQEFLNRPTK